MPSAMHAMHACRFGSTDEVGLFEMTKGGLATVTDPAALLKERSAAAAAAACAAAVVVEANRPMVVEIQVCACTLLHVGACMSSCVVVCGAVSPKESNACMPPPSSLTFLYQRNLCSQDSLL